MEDEEINKDKVRNQAEVDYELFLRDLEEDQDLRAMVNLYKCTIRPPVWCSLSTNSSTADQPEKAATASATADEMETSSLEGDEELPEINLEDLLEDMTLEDTPMSEEEQ